MKHWFRWLTFAIGWLLSPLTPWNDAIINLPIAYLLASFGTRIFPNAFMALFLIGYWLTNWVGILMVVWSGHSLLKGRSWQVRSIRRSWPWMIIYSLLVISLIWIGWLRPF